MARFRALRCVEYWRCRAAATPARQHAPEVGGLQPTPNAGENMLTRRRSAAGWAVLLGVVAWACADAPTAAVELPASRSRATDSWDALATTRWNQRAADLLQTLPVPRNGQAWASRMLTYLSLAQHQA